MGFSEDTVNPSLEAFRQRDRHGWRKCNKRRSSLLSMLPKLQKSPHGRVYGVFSKELAAHNTDYKSSPGQNKNTPKKKSIIK